MECRSLASLGMTVKHGLAGFLHFRRSMNRRLSTAVGLAVGAALVIRTRRKEMRVERLAGALLEVLLNAIEANDPTTGMHLRRTAARALVIADAAGLDDAGKASVERVALFHDIGKLHGALFDIVHNAKKLTDEQRRIILTHPARGANVLAPLAAFYPKLPAGVLAHHERWDGTGYPRGLRGRHIPIEARITAIADTFDAVAQTRPYHRGAGSKAALRVIAEGRGTQFDPELVDLALLPPIARRLAHVHLSKHMLHGRRRSHEHEHVPDISFRWRSESLGSAGIPAMGRVD
jgi:HD-GYP domain-containing protein (c-di-GMP phosphodiesterase class II)